jgi:cytochrome c553
MLNCRLSITVMPLINQPGHPSSTGNPPVYVKAQLQAFATGARRNDISEQMRNIARQMTATEIEDAAHYYASRP